MPKLGLNWGELQTHWEKVRDSGMWTEGYYVKALEDEIAKRYNMHAIAVNSAGTGLYTMLRCAEGLFNHYREIAVQNNTFYATGAMVREVGKQLRLIDCKQSDFSMDAFALRQQRHMGAVILTHVGGGIAHDYQAISDYCRDYDLAFFEDAAHALGAEDVTGALAGQRSDGAVFSLYPTKAIPVGEGGIIVTRHAGFAERMRRFRNYGKHRDAAGAIRYDRSGFNFRMDEWTAAIGYMQVKRLDDILARRVDAANHLARVFDPMLKWPGVSNWYKYAIPRQAAEEFGVKRFTGQVYAETDQLVGALGVGKLSAFPQSKWIADHHVCIPLDEDLYDNMTTDQVVAYLRGA